MGGTAVSGSQFLRVSVGVFNAVLVLGLFPSFRILMPVLQLKAKKGPPRQAKYAIRCIHAMFSNRDTHFAQIFEVSFLTDFLHRGFPAAP